MVKRFSYPGIRFCLAVLLVLTSVGLTMAGQAESHPPFYFVQITDTHMGGLDHNTRTRKIVKQIDRLSVTPVCAVHTGDITEELILDDSTVIQSRTKDPPALYLR